MSKVQVTFPDKLDFLFDPYRYKGAYGGRGSAKSWSFAKALLILGVKSPVRILCAREIQKSIKQSVHKLLSDQIQALGLGYFYEILETEIRGKNGTEFSFSGLASHTIDSIKSFEGCDYCWVEEAHAVSKRSWDVLIPTIRKPNSEIWLTFNPELESDETYQRFVANPPTDSKIIHMNYNDNPWFPDVLEQERLHCENTNKKEYNNIWLGLCKPAAEGAIYFDEVQKCEEDKRVCNLPYDPMLKVHIVMDLGWNDSTAIALVQRTLSEVRIIEYIEDDHKTIDYYSALLREKKYNWGVMYLPHDAFHGQRQTGKTDADIFRRLGWDVKQTQNTLVETGIRNARLMFNRLYFDKTKTTRLIECLKRYKRAINQQTGEESAPFHDEFSHGADCFRYICLNVDKMSNEDYSNMTPIYQNTQDENGLYY